MENLSSNDILHLRKIAEDVYSFRIYFKIYIAGILTVFVLGNILTTVFLFCYLFYEFNIFESIKTQIPIDIRNRYNSKILQIIKWIDHVATESLHSKDNGNSKDKEEGKEGEDKEER
jgi:hypothetical protein